MHYIITRDLSSRKHALRIALDARADTHDTENAAARRVERVKVNASFGAAKNSTLPRAPDAGNFRERARKIPDRESLFTNGPQGE